LFIPVATATLSQHRAEAKDFMDDRATNTSFREIQTYREMAARCRNMAAVSRRPGPLILRAEAFEATALALERGEKQPKIA
jgi:hypothetical protein